LEKAEPAFGDKKERRWSFWVGEAEMKTAGTGEEERKAGREKGSGCRGLRIERKLFDKFSR
jgi:hypothetical protein